MRTRTRMKTQTMRMRKRITLLMMNQKRQTRTTVFSLQIGICQCGQACKANATRARAAKTRAGSHPQGTAIGNHWTTGPLLTVATVCHLGQSTPHLAAGPPSHRRNLPMRGNSFFGQGSDAGCSTGKPPKRPFFLSEMRMKTLRASSCVQATGEGQIPPSEHLPPPPCQTPSARNPQSSAQSCKHPAEASATPRRQTAGRI
mmetsp:Transcript_123704/g.225007  ORF Transcript_123704/g.225007 Transcript_123704/m.225007 type:complete len:201 (-) Transcript_123704:82-684(-)